MPLYAIIFLLLFRFFVSIRTAEEEDADAKNNINEYAEGDEGDDGMLVRELSDAELRRIVAEKPLDDPLNAFFDPFEPYRLSNFAYWHPITFPKERANPPIPTGFLPTNAPPKIFPSDFFFDDDEALRIVQGEHAASFCPWLRFWRDKNPLKPYPIGDDFLQRHPPIKFVPGKGYEVDHEVARLNFLTRQAQEEILGKASAAAADSAEAGDNQNSNSNAAYEDFEDDDGKELSSPKKKNKKSKRKSELDLLLDSIEKVKSERQDCKKDSAFLEEPVKVSSNPYWSALPGCLQEAIFVMEEYIDKNIPEWSDDSIPELVDKSERYRAVLLELKGQKSKNKKGGKCPFGFDGKKNKKHQDEPTVKIFQGSVPRWAKAEANENLLIPSDEDEGKGAKKVHSEGFEKYRFSYKQVPFPSIQDTLKKYVSL